MPHIIPIKELKNTAEISELCHKTDGPVYITKNGYGDMVLMSMESFEKISSRLKMYENLELAENQLKKGETKDARASLSAMREKYDL
ncbi:MAG TPA: type II toxin-antitoxin system Phd/YefM family antitoxin [Candidatus Eisenbergiella merdavium]|uniref:Antitoxin n=1 Tax=Candidatus Eisenbergiella merdavium TaxID=2838551 RepID=A0A9D2NC66_9FIRM|nr:type II toxin-antitoxin system Phd/YefM family antitoxin [Candidatus Eisenbergiella merdavium]